MRRKLVVGNWKMNGSAELVNDMVSALCAYTDDIDVALCVPYIYLPQALQISGKVGIGAQDVSEHDKGAFTGEISAAMLSTLGLQYVLVGHSERRQYHAETNKQVVDKVRQALRHDISPVVCVGETRAQREGGETESVISSQLKPVLDALGNDELKKITIAYEPVWAIGTGLAATTEQAQAVHAHIRQTLVTRDMNVADTVRILYGGSVKPSNAAELFAQQDIDGGLVGGASLLVDDFCAICDAAAGR